MGVVKLSRRLRVLAYVALALAAVLVYLPALGGGFVWDDQALIVDNPSIKSWDHVGEILSRDFFHLHDDNTPYGYYRPVVTVSYLLEYRLWGLNPFGFHATNVLLHAVGTILVALILRRLRFSDGLGMTVALLFALHPIHTENVAWIAGRTDLIAFVLTMAAFLFHVMATDPLVGMDGERQSARARLAKRRSIFVGFSLAAFATGLLAKEMSVVLIPWLALFLWLVRERSWQRIAVDLSPYLLVLAAYCLWRFWALGIEVPESSDHRLSLALMSAAPTTVRYLGWMLVPLDLCAYVLNPYVMTLGDPRLLGALFLLGLLVPIAWRLLRSREERFVLAMLLTSFLPILNLVRVAGPVDMGNAMSERFCYFPSFPFLATLALLVARLLGEKRRSLLIRRTGVGFLVVIAGLGATQTVLRTRDWSDEYTFLTTALEQSPGSALLWQAMGLCRLKRATGTESVGQQGDGRRPELDRAELRRAVDAYRTAARLNPMGATTQLNIGTALYMLGDVEGAATALREAVWIDPTYIKAHINLGAALQDSGETDSAIAEYRKAIELLGASERIADPTLQADLSGAHYNLGRALLAGGDAGDALLAFREALRIRPDLIGHVGREALLLAREGDLDSAALMLREVVSTQPGNVAARSYYGRVLASLGRLDEAQAVIQAGMGQATAAERESLGSVLTSIQSIGQPQEHTPIEGER